MGWFGDLLEDTGLSGLLSDGRWVTLSNGKRVKLSPDGRIVAGLPAKYHGIHVGDFTRVSKEEREILAVDCDELAACHKCEQTFSRKEIAVRALFAANAPKLQEIVDESFGAYDHEWLKWYRAGRRGPKPRTRIDDGRLDAVNETLDLLGAHRVGGLLEAVYRVVPASGRWADLTEEQLRPLSEAVGFQVQPPEEAIKVQSSRLSAEDCRRDVDARLAKLLDKARAGLEPAPF